MRYCLSAVFFCSALLFLGAGDASPTNPPQLSVHFSPRGGCTASVVAAVAEAKHSVLVQAYVLTSEPIAAALAQAKARGVDVKVVVDKKGRWTIGSKIDWLEGRGVPCWIDGRHPIAHNKVIIIDGNQVLTGSFNFTEQAEIGNAENLLTIRHEPTAQLYEQNWREHYDHAVRFAREKPIEVTEPSDERQTNSTSPPENKAVYSAACSNGRCTLIPNGHRFRRR